MDSSISPVPSPDCWSDADAQFYVEGLDASTYESQVVAALPLPLPVESLLEVGAGDGRIGERVVASNGLWTAVEPNGYLYRKLRDKQRRHSPDRSAAIYGFWQDLPRFPLSPHEAVLCCNIPDTTRHAATLWTLLRPMTARHMLWVVPAQTGPSTFCLANLLPPELHRCNAEPAYLQTVSNLEAVAPPPQISFFDWFFCYPFPSLEEAMSHFADRLARFGHDFFDSAEGLLHEALLQRLIRQPNGQYLAVSPKRSAVLHWQFGP